MNVRAKIFAAAIVEGWGETDFRANIARQVKLYTSLFRSMENMSATHELQRNSIYMYKRFTECAVAYRHG